MGAACALIVAGFLACAGRPAPKPAEPLADATAAVLLAGIHAALGGGDVIEAARLADLARQAEMTEEQVNELAALAQRFGDSDPTDPGVGADGGGVTYAGPSPARAVGAGVDGADVLPAYIDLPFFDAYRDDTGGGNAAWFDLGSLTVSTTDAAAPSIHLRGARGDRVVVLDLGGLLVDTGADGSPQAYHGLSRARHGRLLHHYIDAAGRATTGATETADDGATRTMLLRHVGATPEAPDLPDDGAMDAARRPSTR